MQNSVPSGVSWLKSNLSILDQKVKLRSRSQNKIMAIYVILLCKHNKNKNNLKNANFFWLETPFCFPASLSSIEPHFHADENLSWVEMTLDAKSHSQIPYRLGGDSGQINTHTHTHTHRHTDTQTDTQTHRQGDRDSG